MFSDSSSSTSGTTVSLSFLWGPLVAQKLKRLPAMRETWVRSLGREDPLEKEMATYSSILAWRIPWTEEPGGLQSTGLQRVRHDWATSLHFTSLWLFFSIGLPWWLRICLQCRRSGFHPRLGRAPGKGNGYPLQYYCWRTPWTEEPGGATVHGGHKE